MTQTNEIHPRRLVKVKEALDSLIDSHHQYADHAVTGFGNDAGAENASFTPGAGAAIDQGIVAFTSARHGEASDYPVLVSDPETTTMSLRPGVERTLRVTSKPANAWPALAAFLYELDSRVPELHVDEAQHVFCSLLVNRQPATGEKGANEVTPLERLLEKLLVARHQDGEAADLPQPLAQIALPLSDQIGTPRVAACPSRGRGNLERVSIDEHHDGTDGQRRAPEGKGQARAGVFPHPRSDRKRVAKDVGGAVAKAVETGILVPARREGYRAGEVRADRLEQPDVECDEGHALPVALGVLAGRRHEIVAAGRLEPQQADEARRRGRSAPMRAQHENARLHQYAERNRRDTVTRP